MDMKKIGAVCKYHRNTRLGMTLKEIEGSHQIKTLSAFEHGSSTNIRHLIKYIQVDQTEEQRNEFIEDLVEVIINE